MTRTAFFSQLAAAKLAESAALATYRQTLIATIAAESATFDAPTAPGNPVGNFDESGALHVSFEPAAETVGHRVYRKPTSSSGSSDEQADSNGAATFVGPFTEDQDVWVEAHNEVGNSWSERITVTFPQV